MKICIVDGCENPAGTGRGMCHKHYKRWNLHGHTGLTSGKGCGDAKERLSFRGKLSEFGCLEWQGTLAANGYGQTKWNYKFYSVHRLAWVLEFGPIPEGMFVCHRCDNPKCFNVDHLFLGTPSENTRDSIRKGRRWATKRKLSDSDVVAIRASVRKAPDLAKDYGVSDSCVYRVLSGKTWPDEASRRKG